GGTVFNTDWCAVVDEIPADLDVIRYWDVAATENTDFNAPDCTVGTSPPSPIRPAVPRFSRGKSLSDKGCRGLKRRKSAVVPTKSILKAANMPIIGGHHVLALQGSPEGWQATSLLERCREHADRQGARGAAAC